MSRAARRDTAPELALRRLLHAAGMRYRVNYPVPRNRRRTIDVAFTRARIAIFVDGCFWHSCPEHGTSPAANSQWWETKLRTNTERDRDTDRLLEDSGWEVLRFWELEAPDLAMKRVAATVAYRKAPDRPHPT